MGCKTKFRFLLWVSLTLGCVLAQNQAAVAQQFDILLQGGHVIDPRSGIDGVRDVGIRGNRIAAVEANLDPSGAARVVHVAGLYVTPGLIDIHVHVFAGTGEVSSYAGDNSVYPDGFTFRSGVTTVADAGCAGWRNFEEFKIHVIDRSKTRVLAFLNIVGHGMRGDAYEHALDDMLIDPAVAMARKYPETIVGIKTAHYLGPEFIPVERAVATGMEAVIPVMVDFGKDFATRPIEKLLMEKMRPGDIYTHVFSGLRRELLENRIPNPVLRAAQERGVILDVGHGGGSFSWRVAVPCAAAGIIPDTISTDLHIGSMNAGMKDMLNVMSKLLTLGVPLQQVIEKSTWRPAIAIQRKELGNLSIGSGADIAVLRLEEGNFGFVDSFGYRQSGNRKLTCELTLRDGQIVYDLNGLSRPEWNESKK